MRLHAFACKVRGSAGRQTIQVLQVGGITPAVCTCGVATVQPAVGDGRLGRHDVARDQRGAEAIENFGRRDCRHAPVS